jgi:hypothetical protein
MSQSTADLRRWSRVDGFIFGYVYNDPDGNYEDGEQATFDDYVLADNGTFYVLKATGPTIFKLSKDDENAR